jgi:seryl-tRNA(Sec) selenium transferase
MENNKKDIDLETYPFIIQNKKKYINDGYEMRKMKVKSKRKKIIGDIICAIINDQPGMTIGQLTEQLLQDEYDFDASQNLKIFSDDDIVIL